MKKKREVGRSGRTAEIVWGERDWIFPWCLSPTNSPQPFSSFFLRQSHGLHQVGRQVGELAAGGIDWQNVSAPKAAKQVYGERRGQRTVGRASSARYRPPSTRAAPSAPFVGVRPMSGRDARAPLVAQPTAVTVSPHLARYRTTRSAIELRVSVPRRASRIYI